MGTEKNHIIYTAEDIQEYLSGKLAPARMHAMEKAALDDAFLAEAMEGYAGMQQQQLEEQLLLLRNNFAKAPASKVVALQPAARFRLWKVAAAVLIIVVGVAASYLLTSDKRTQNNTIAALHDAKRDTGNSMATAPASTDTNATITAVDNQKYKPTKLRTITHPNQTVLADSAFVYRPGNMAKKDEKHDEGGGYADDKLKDRNDIATNNAAPNALQNKTEQAGKINNAAAAEAVKAADLVKNTPLTIDTIKNNIALAETATALKGKSAGADVAVVGYGTRRRTNLTKDSVTAAEPVDGWEKYYGYITNNLKIPDDARDNNIHGEVEVYFEVRMNGTITNMKIAKPLCDECDKAAMQLIKEGPPWKVKNGIAGTAKVIVKF